MSQHAQPCMIADYLLYGKLQIAHSSYQEVLKDLTVETSSNAQSKFSYSRLFPESRTYSQTNKIFLRVFTSV